MNATANTNASTKEAVWFDKFVSNLVDTVRSHEHMLQTKTAPADLVDFYQDLFDNNIDELCRSQKAHVQQHFVRRIMVDYLKELGGSFPLKLAFNYNDSEVLVWAEIGDDNEDQEKHLILAEAKINAAYHSYGFDMETMIVEVGDALSIPAHYKVFKS